MRVFAIPQLLHLLKDERKLVGKLLACHFRKVGRNRSIIGGGVSKGFAHQATAQCQRGAASLA